MRPLVTGQPHLFEAMFGVAASPEGVSYVCASRSNIVTGRELQKQIASDVERRRGMVGK